MEKQVDNNLTEEDQDFVDIPSEEVTNATFEEGNELVDMAVVQGNTDEENDQDAYLDGNESNTEDTENSDSEANDSEDRISVKYGRKSRSRSRSKYGSRRKRRGSESRSSHSGSRSSDGKRRKIKKCNKRRTRSINPEDKKKIIDKTYSMLRGLMQESGLLKEKRDLPTVYEDQEISGSKGKGGIKPQVEKSETTIYRDAIPRCNRFSSSSEDGRNTSRDITNQDGSEDEEIVFKILVRNINNEVIDVTRFDPGVEGRDQRRSGSQEVDDNPPMSNAMMQRQQADRIVREAEAGKARIFDVTGEQQVYENENVLLNNAFLHALSVDKSYQLIGGHLTDSVKRKICDGEYTDYGKLLPRDKVRQEEDDRVEILNKGGKMILAPFSGRDSVTHCQNGNKHLGFIPMFT